MTPKDTVWEPLAQYLAEERLKELQEIIDGPDTPEVPEKAWREQWELIQEILVPIAHRLTLLYNANHAVLLLSECYVKPQWRFHPYKAWGRFGATLNQWIASKDTHGVLLVGKRHVDVGIRWRRAKTKTFWSVGALEYLEEQSELVDHTIRQLSEGNMLPRGVHPLRWRRQRYPREFQGILGLYGWWTVLSLGGILWAALGGNPWGTSPIAVLWQFFFGASSMAMLISFFLLGDKYFGIWRHRHRTLDEEINAVIGKDPAEN